MTVGFLFRLAWALWALSWVAASFWSARSVKRAAAADTRLNRVVTIAGAVLLFGGPFAWPRASLIWSIGTIAAVVLGLLMLSGFAFAWWARLHLGRFWSSSITRKEGHQLIDTGPYALVRHPIYTGLIAAALATAAAEATWLALLGGALMALGFWLKAALEERFLSEELGVAAYDAYRRRVPMLVPFVPTTAR
jgi:protein-S-isoprenylcysteine O-methyltransferase Ste14